MKPVTCLLFLVSLCLPVQAEMYKWVDEQGVTHYSQQKPPAGVDVNTVKPPPKVDTESAVRALEQKQQQFKERGEAEDKKAAAAQKAQQEMALKKSNCEKAKARVTSTQRPRVNTVDAEGNSVRLGEAERQKRLDEARKALKEHCQ
jgi:hypothetical protein